MNDAALNDVVLTDAGVADLLKVSRSTVRRMWWRKQFPAPVQVGVLNRWRRSDVETWLAEQPQNDLYHDATAAQRKLV